MKGPPSLSQSGIKYETGIRPALFREAGVAGGKDWTLDPPPSFV